MSRGPIVENKIKIYKPERKRIDKFVEARVNADTTLYSQRGGFKEIDILTGALAEEAVYQFLRKFKFKVNKPDFTIHTKKQKSYAGDLTDGKRCFHVKGQNMESAKRYGDSWLMQRYDPLVKGKDAASNNYIVPCTVDTKKNTVIIHGIFTFGYLHKHDLFMDCKVPWFNKTKCAIYGENLPSRNAFRMLWKGKDQ